VTTRNSNLTSGHLLASNVSWNLLGSCAPLLVAVFAVPLLIKGMGTDRFGILTLVWVLIGYFGLFDFGLGRALTKLVAENLGAGQDEEIPSLVWTSLFLMTILGAVGSILLILVSPWLVYSVLKIPESLRAEALCSFYWLSASIPLVTSTAGLRGFLEAHQKFGLVNAARIPFGVFTFAGPLVVLPFTRSLASMAAVLVVGRAGVWIAYLLFCLRMAPHLRSVPAITRPAIAQLVRFGMWMTISNVASPLMVYLDRFVIGAMISVAAVAYYATPYEVVGRLLVIPGAVAGVLFPAFSTGFVQDRNRIVALLDRGTKYVFLALFPIILIVVTLAHEGLGIWLGSEFARQSAPVLQLLALGVLLNALAQIPFAQVQAAGRPDLMAKLHLAELPLYLFALWRLISAYGIAGAAIAWAARVGVDMALLFVFSWRLLRESAKVMRRTAVTVGAALAVLGLAAFPAALSSRIAFLLVALAGFAVAAWFVVLTPEERATIRHRLRLYEVPRYGD